MIEICYHNRCKRDNWGGSFILRLCDLSIVKKIILIFNSLFKYEKHESKSNVSIQNMNQTNIHLHDHQLVKEIVAYLPKSRRGNVEKIISDAQQNIDKENHTKITPPEHEWLGPFLDNCKDVCSEDLQKIWSKLLHGKINRKSNTSIRTMSVLNKINSSEASLFNRFLKYRIGDYVYYEENKMPSNFPLFDKISLLFEIGLVNQMNNIVTIIKSKVISPHIRVGVLGVYYDYLLFVNFQPEQTEVRIPSVRLSKAGVELSQFVNHQKDNAYLSCLSKFLKSKGLQLKSTPQIKGTSEFLWFTAGEDVN